MPKLKPTSDLVRAALIDLWVKGETFTNQAISARITAQGGELSNTSVATQITRWKTAGILDTQLSPAGVGENVLRLTFGGPETEGATLQAVLSAAAGENGLPTWAQSNLRTAMRVALALPPGTDTQAILDAAATVPASELHGLPARYQEAAKAQGGEAAMIANLVSVVRRALRLAADQDLIPLEFPHLWGDDQWEALRWTFFPDEARGVSLATSKTYRSQWAHFAREVKAMLAAPPYSLAEARFGDVTVEMVAALQRDLKRRGRRALANQVSTILHYVGREHGEGPFAKQFGPDAPKRNAQGRVDVGYLVAADGRAAADGNWGTFIEIFRSRGFSPEWIEFWEWYRDYSTLEDDALEQDPVRFPVRPEVRRLQHDTVVQRMNGVRAWVGQALVALRRRPEDLTLRECFGTQGRIVAQRLKTWWADRAARGEVSDATSSGVTKSLIAGAMIARALYDRSVHARGVRLEQADVLKIREWEEQSKTLEEEAYYRCYTSATTIADQLEDKRRESDEGHIHTTVRDIGRMIENTPPAWWVRVLDEMLRRVREGWDAGCRGERFHRFVEATYLLGFLISAGLRRSELAHLRLGQYANAKGQVRDRQYGPGNRARRWARLRAKDRKNRKKHVGVVRERFCPRWLEDLYLEHSRPFLMARGGQEHDWLFVDACGRPYGCVGEADDGTRMAEQRKAFSDQKKLLTRFFQDQVGPVAASLGLDVPVTPQEFGLHVIRGVFGYLLYQDPAYGVIGAANWLGDTIDQVEGTYAETDGTAVDVSGCEQFAEGMRIALVRDAEDDDEEGEVRRRVAARRRSHRGAPAGGAEDDYYTALTSLLDCFKRKLIDDGEFTAAKEALRHKFGIAAPRRKAS